LGRADSAEISRSGSYFPTALSALEGQMDYQRLLLGRSRGVRALQSLMMKYLILWTHSVHPSGLADANRPDCASDAVDGLAQIAHAAGGWRDARLEDGKAELQQLAMNPRRARLPLGSALEFPRRGQLSSAASQAFQPGGRGRRRYAN